MLKTELPNETQSSMRQHESKQAKWRTYLENATAFTSIDEYEFPIFCAVCAIMSSGEYDKASIVTNACNLLEKEREAEILALLDKYGDEDAVPVWQRRSDGTYELDIADCHRV